MNIVYSSSDNYAEICGISLISLLENNKEVDHIKIFIIDNNISDSNKQKLTDTVQKYNRSIEFKNCLDLEQITKTSIYVGRWNISTFFRLFLTNILPDYINRVIYLDCDTIIRKSLNDVYNLSLNGKLVAGVDDCRSDLYRKEINCEPGSVYINNGFLLIDLNEWRNENIAENFSKFISERKGNLTYMDQAPLNGVLGKQNKIYELPAIYNSQRIFFDFSYEELLKLRKPNHHLSKEEYFNAINDPIIIHFTPTFLTGTRPWQKLDNHKFGKEYRHYKDISEWNKVPYRNDDRKFGKKVMSFICKITPKFLLIPIMSYLHATWYPKKRIKIRDKNIRLEN